MKSVPPRIFDPIARARERARAERMDGDLFLVREAAQGVAGRVVPVNRYFARAIDIEPFAGTAPILKPLAGSWSIASFDRDETLIAEWSGVDLVTSLLCLHSINDLPGALIQIRSLLKPDGLFAGAILGGSTLDELRNSMAAAEIAIAGGLSPRVAPLGDVRDLGNLLLRAGFALPVADVERTTVLYRDIGQLVRDLRSHAQTNTLAARSRTTLGRRVMREAVAHYQEHYAEPDGRLRATFDIIYVTGFAPAGSQPRPLRPGSARMRLADALGTREYSAGEAVKKPTRD